MIRSLHALSLAALLLGAAISAYAAPMPSTASTKAAQRPQALAPPSVPSQGQGQTVVPPKLELATLGGYLVAQNSDPILAVMIADRALKNRDVDAVWNERLKGLKEPIKDLQGKVIYPVPKDTAYPLSSNLLLAVACVAPFLSALLTALLCFRIERRRKREDKDYLPPPEREAVTQR